MDTRVPPLASRIIAEARTWLGTKFHHQGDCKGVGVDCVMLPISIGKAVGVVPPDFDPRPYPRGWFLRDSRYLEMLAPFVGPREGTPQPGDIALFRVGRAPAHAAIVVAWPRVIHADPEGVVEETDALTGSTPGRFVCAVTPRAGVEGRA